jgi:N utilization substance protein A
VSRSHPEFIRSLFELEVPELVDGDVEIRAIAREPGHRTKIAVASNDPNVDPVGACVGARGSRVRQVVNELRGEKVDIVEWRDDTEGFIAEALSPARVKEVRLDEDERTAEVVVPDHQLSLAIGKEGQNARLAARLSGYRIDIRSESQDLGLDIEEEEDAPVEAVVDAAVVEAVVEEVIAEEAVVEEVAEIVVEEAVVEEVIAEEAVVEEVAEIIAEEAVVEEAEATVAEEAATEEAGEDSSDAEVENEEN